MKKIIRSQKERRKTPNSTEAFFFLEEKGTKRQMLSKT